MCLISVTCMTLNQIKKPLPISQVDKHHGRSRGRGRASAGGRQSLGHRAPAVQHGRCAPGPFFLLSRVDYLPG